MTEKCLFSQFIIFQDVFHGLETGLNTAKGGLTDAGYTIAGLGGTVIHGIGDIGGSAIDGIENVANTVAGAVTDAANSVGHFFQSKRDKTANLFEINDILSSNRLRNVN